jgi:predicted TIM-barrel fold metal-dependent hydrolase
MTSENPRLARRHILAGTAAASLALATTTAPQAAQPPKDQRWIDAHSHIWSREIDKFPLAEGTTLDDLAPPSFTARELLEVAHAHDVGRVVLIQHHKFHGWDNRYLIDAARRYPDTFRVVGMVDNFSPSPGEQMRRLLPQRVTGFRITPRVHQQKWLAGGMDEMWRTAADTGQAICCLIDAENLDEIGRMCTRHEGTPVVIDHFARIGVDGMLRERDIAALCRLARHQHVRVKLSAYYALGAKRPPYRDLIPLIRRVLDAFGPHRCMWASDSPYQLDGDHTYGASIALIRDALDFLSEGDRRQLLRETAQSSYFFA